MNVTDRIRNAGLGLKNYVFGWQYPDGGHRPAPLWEKLHPREADAYWAQRAEEEELRIAPLLEQIAADERYDKYAADCDYGPQKGNPPESDRLDEEIQRFTEEFPEMSEAEREQIDFVQTAYEQGPRGSFPEYEGPGFTEPPLNWVAPGEHDGWTFSQWAEEHGYDPEVIEDINREFPPDEAEQEYARQRDLDRAEYEREFWAGYEGASPEPGTAEWHYEHGYDPEPDWTHDPAADPRDGTRYYDDGRITTWDGKAVKEATPEPTLTPEVQADPLAIGISDSKGIQAEADDLSLGSDQREYPEMGPDYYTQPVGSDRHRQAYREQFEAGGFVYGAFPDDADASYKADHWAELEYDRLQEKLEAQYAAEPDVYYPADPRMIQEQREEAERNPGPSTTGYAEWMEARRDGGGPESPKAPEADQAQRLP
jgi:hypothetical protein